MSYIKQNILRSPEADPMAVAVKDNKNMDNFPVLKDTGIITVIIRDIKVGPGSKPGSNLLTLKLETKQDLPNTDGAIMHAGFKISDMVSLTPSEKRPIKNVANDVSRIIRGVEGANASTTPKMLVDKPGIYEGKPVKIKVGFSPGKDGYADRNRITYIPA